MSKFITFICTFCLFFLVTSTIAQAGNEVIDSVEIVESPESTEIHIFFNTFLQYVTHAPSSTGDYIRINMRPVGTRGFDAEDLLTTENVDWKPTPNLPLLEITYEGISTFSLNDFKDPANGLSSKDVDARLRIRFQKNVDFRVKGSTDLRSIVIFIAKKIVDISEPTTEKKAAKKLPLLERKERPLKPERLESMLEEAKKEMTAKNYNRAIQLYSRIILHPDPQTQQQSLEFLGLARERKGQLAHAKALYEEYLQTYPDAQGAVRVQQRLSGMLTARAQPKNKLRSARATPEGDAWQASFFGSVAQSYNYDQSVIDDEWNGNINALTSDTDLNLRFRNNKYDIQAAFSGSNENDFSDDSDDTARLSEINIDALHLPSGLYGKIGRQSLNTGGVLGRFDGAAISYPLTPTIKINGVIGAPVESTRQTNINNNHLFYGINFDLGTYDEKWDYNLFFIHQDVDGITDRQAIGGEISYYQPNLSLFTLIDYDIFYNQLNTALFVGNWKATEKTSFNTQAEFRKSPILTTSNALQGQPAETIDDLKTLFTEDEITNLADDRTADSTSILVGITQTLNDIWQVTGDVTTTKIYSTEASGGVAANPATDNDFFYNLQFIGSGLLKEGDLVILGARYAVASSRKITTLSIKTRYPFTRNFRINPRLSYEYRTNDNDSGTRSKIEPSFRIDYRWGKNVRFELENGIEITHEETVNTTINTRRYFVLFTYRYLF